MSPLPVASSPKLRKLLAVAFLVAAPLSARAQERTWTFVRSPTAVPARAAQLSAALTRAFGALEFEPVRAAATRAGLVPRERLLPIIRVQAALTEAREQAALMAEGEALSALAEAARIGNEFGDVEGAAAWNAEIQLGIGVTAAQAGLIELAQVAFRVALTLDPGRRLLEAEAAPSVVALYERVQREAALAPAGQLEVAASAPNARVFLDDVAVGQAPARFHASVGRHILRVDAPGHRAYGAWIDVLEGVRPKIAVELAPSGELEVARELEQAVAHGDYARVTSVLRDAHAAGSHRSHQGEIFALEQASSGERTLLIRCGDERCEAPLRFDTSRALGTAARRAPVPPLTAERLADARAWLERLGPYRDVPTPPSTPLWQRWYFWGAIAAVAVVGTVLGVQAASERAHRFRVVIEPADVGQ